MTHLSAIEKSRRRAQQNLRIGNRLSEAAEPAKDIASEVTADLLKLSADDTANGELKNLMDKKGREFSCPKSLISASTLLDSSYQAKTSKRHRKTIYRSFQSHLQDIIDHGLYVSFITPTFPNLLGVGFADNDRFQTLAWEKFLQTKEFKDFFYGGYAKTESTLGGKKEREKTGDPFDLFIHGLNYHLHALCINYKPFASGETSALENRLAMMNKSKKYTAEDKRLIRNSLRIVRAWTRCIKQAYREIFGKPLKINTLSGLARFTFQNVSIDEIKNADPEQTKKGIFWEIGKTASYTAKGNNFEELPPDLLLDAENTFRNKRMINGFGVFRKYAERKKKSSTSLVKGSTKQSGNEESQPSKPLLDNVLRGEYEPLKSYGIRLCSQGLRKTWLKYLDVNKDLIIGNQRKALLDRLPDAIFTDLSGKTYYGWRAKRLLLQKQKESEPNYVPTQDKYHLFKQYQAQYFALDNSQVPVDLPRVIHCPLLHTTQTSGSYV